MASRAPVPGVATARGRGPRGKQWEKVGNRTQGEKRGRGAMGVECTLAVIGTRAPVYTLCRDQKSYTLEVTDSFGDGMCCDFGRGSLRLLRNGKYF
eukprot:1192782-Prorocentrum_minimum.AAC.5